MGRRDGSRAWVAAAIFVLVLASACGSNQRSARGSSSVPDVSTSGGAPASMAAAKAVTFRDPRGDVFDLTGDQEWPLDARPAPHQVYSDVVSTRVLHDAVQVQVEIEFADLFEPGEHRPRATLRVEVEVHTDEGVARDATFDFGGRLETARMSLLHPFGQSVRCSIDHSVDYRRNVVTLDIPRRCLSKSGAGSGSPVPPRWVRIGVSSVAWLQDRAETFASDDALTAGYDARRQHLGLTPRIPAGD